MSWRIFVERNEETCGNGEKASQNEMTKEATREEKKLVKEKYDLLVTQLTEIKDLKIQAEEQQSQFEEFKRISESQTDIVKFLEDQIRVVEQEYEEASDESKLDLSRSLRRLKEMLDQEETVWQNIDKDLMQTRKECDDLCAQLTDLSMELPFLLKEYLELEEKMKLFYPEISMSEEKYTTEGTASEQNEISTFKEEKDNLNNGMEDYWRIRKSARTDIGASEQNEVSSTFKEQTDSLSNGIADYWRIRKSFRYSEQYPSHSPSIIPSCQCPTHQTGAENNDNFYETDWLFGKISRDKVLEILANKPDGRFLVCETPKYPYVLSLVHEGSVKHIPILHGPKGYGFVEDNAIHETLRDLLVHYRKQSLRIHNRTLNTTLKFPCRFLDNTKEPASYQRKRSSSAPPAFGKL